MKCKNCENFKTKKKNDRVEASKELSFFDKSKGNCSIDNKECKADDACGCGEFSEKENC